MSAGLLMPYSADTRRGGGGGGGGDRSYGGGRTRSSYHWTERSTVARSGTSCSRDDGRDSSASAKSLFVNPFGFHSKTSYDAAEVLMQCRSDGFELPEPEKDDDIWKRPPPDFRPQCYAPRPPKRNSRDAVQPWKYGTLPGKREGTGKRAQKSSSAPVRLPHLLLGEAGQGAGLMVPGAGPEEEHRERFVTGGFAIPDANRARLQCARDGTFKPGPFSDPTHHDFRGYPSLKSLGLDEFEMKTEHDPYNIHFKTERLDVMHGLPRGVATDRDTSGRQMAPPLPSQPQWEARLILPKSPWPKLSGEYTRHRMPGRSPHSALMERIEEKLSHDWARQKLDDALRKCGGGAEGGAEGGATVQVRMERVH